MTTDAAPKHDPELLGPRGYAVRVLVTLALAVGFLGGTWVGDDWWWPFAPWRMFATSTAPSGSVVFYSLEVKDADDTEWRRSYLNLKSIGLNRAEVEGRLDQLREDPSLLGTLAETHAELVPGDQPWVAIRLIRNASELKDRKPTGVVRQTVVSEWSARA